MLGNGCETEKLHEVKKTGTVHPRLLLECSLLISLTFCINIVSSSSSSSGCDTEVMQAIKVL